MDLKKEQLEAAYFAGKSVHDGFRTIGEAVDHLSTTHGMNRNSANDLVRNFQKMMSGEKFTRTLSAPCIEIYLAGIRSDYGDAYMRNAISAVSEHVDYYENHRKTTLSKVRAILSKYSRMVSEPVDLIAHQAHFEAAVSLAAKESKASLESRLKGAEKRPKTTRLSVTAYQRNPDVVAFVLMRAAGTCERCHKKAPFLRRKDGTPYLEVHHKVLLANNGEDTVDNAIALCPNCHRELHFGAVSG
jgi:5-methylcytosine-specific restriction protein A